MASSDILIKRDAVTRAYASDKWQKKVQAMSDDQVIAIYLRLKAQNKI